MSSLYKEFYPRVFYLFNQCVRFNLSIKTILQSDMICDSIFGPKKGSFRAFCSRITIVNFYSHTYKFKLILMFTMFFYFEYIDDQSILWKYTKKIKPFEVNNNSKITLFYMDTKETIYWNRKIWKTFTRVSKFKLTSNSIPYLQSCLLCWKGGISFLEW